MQWGQLQFEVWPLNFHEYDHSTGTSWAVKDVMESSPQREWTGEEDEEIGLRGRIFPYHIGGLQSIDLFDRMRREAQAHLLIRGGTAMGQVMGWYVCETLVRSHQNIGPHGIGKVINFECQFARVDPPWADNYYPQIYATSQA